MNRGSKVKFFDGAQEIAQLSTEQNIKRISYVSCVFVAFQLINLFDERFRTSWYLIASSIITSIICIVYTIVTVKWYSAIVVNAKKARFFYLSFWLAMITFGATPFFIFDILGDRPANATILLAALIIVPMFIKRDIFIVFPLYGIYNLALAYIFGANLPYMLYIFGTCAAGAFMAYLIQQRYVDLIVKFKHETRVDPLTNILNRRGGLDKMHTVIELCKRHGMNIVVYMLDIDFFKDYNDTFGHIRGDQVLIEISKEIGHVFSRSSDVICRFGGEEFVICTSVANTRDAHDMANLLRESIEELEITSARQDVSDCLTISVGYTIYKPLAYDAELDADMDAMSLIEEADAALYAAKNSGRNTTFSFVATAQDNGNNAKTKAI